MLQNIRGGMKSTGAKVVVYGIAGIFALFGAEAIVGGLGGEPEVASVDGAPITEYEFVRAVELQRRAQLSAMGDAADPDLIDDVLLRQETLQALIDNKVLVENARQQGLVIPDAQINQMITNDPNFQTDGVFSPERFETLLRSSGFTVQGYKDEFVSQGIVQQLRTGLVSSAFSTSIELEEMMQISRQERTFGEALLFSSDFVGDIETPDSELKSFYESRKEDYRRPEQYDVAFVGVSLTDYSANVEVSEEELLSFYEEDIANFSIEEQRSARHILVSIEGDVSAEDALAKATTLKSDIDAGADFSELAKNNSDDEGSAENGGALGYTARGVFVQPFEDALFAMSEGEVSEPVETEYGYHIIKLDDIQENEPPSFEESRVAIEQQLQQEKAQSEFVDAASLLEEIAYSAPDLDEPADELGLEIQTRKGITADTEDPIFSNTKVQRALQSDSVKIEGNNSNVIQITPDFSIAFRIVDIHPDRVPDYDEVVENVRADYVIEQAGQRAESVGQAFIARASSGEDAALVAEDLGLQWTRHEKAKRSNVMIDNSVMETAFALRDAPGEIEISGVKLATGDYAVVVLYEVNRDETELSDTELLSMGAMLDTTYGSEDYNRYEASVIASTPVEVFE